MSVLSGVVGPLTFLVGRALCSFSSGRISAKLSHYKQGQRLLLQSGQSRTCAQLVRSKTCTQEVFRRQRKKALLYKTRSVELLHVSFCYDDLPSLASHEGTPRSVFTHWDRSGIITVFHSRTVELADNFSVCLDSR
jgi:hypothetical protein